jgi:poly(glycerol-phosphate) alpha-glucosyltransferase
MAHGCPVIAYDIKYGPREQIDDGVDGFLVPKGDIEGMAERAVRLLRDPALVARMSEAAFAKAEQHNHARFLRDWKHVIEGAVALRPNRTVIKSGELKVKRFKVRPPGRVPALTPSARRARTPGAGHEVRFAGDIVLTVGRNEELIDEANVTLTAISEADGALAEIPVRVRRKGTTFSVRSRFSTDWLFDALGPEAPDAHLRLRVDWRNSTWETFLGPEARLHSSVEASFEPDGDLTLARPDAST